jgi:competence ComEA-like helix-hairpin-helix protein
MNWKDWLYFTKSQRIGVAVLLVLIVAAIVLNALLPKLFPQKTDGFNAKFTNEAAAFKSELQSLDSLRQANWERQYEERYRQNYSNWNTNKTHSKSDAYTLFAFNPNTLDSVGFVRLGLRNWQAANILNYRRKGGKFSTKDDFAKVYGLSTEKFKELQPFIQIPEPETSANEDAKTTENKDIAENIAIEINAADTTELQKVRGIGRYLAGNIVYLRNTLGGFVSVEQLREVRGMRPENYEQIAQKFTIDLSKVQKIRVNTASTDKLSKHPYINFYQAKAIYELRRSKIKLQNINDLHGEKDFTDEWFEKIAPYLSFE